MPNASLRARRTVSWSDTDASGRHHFTSVFRWVEDTENQLLEELGVADELAGRMPRVHVEADYQAPLRFRQEVDVELSVARLGSTSITFEFVIRSEDAVAASGRYVVVLVDDAGQPVPLSTTTAARINGTA